MDMEVERKRRGFPIAKHTYLVDRRRCTWTGRMATEKLSDEHALRTGEPNDLRSSFEEEQFVPFLYVLQVLSGRNQQIEGSQHCGR